MFKDNLIELRKINNMSQEDLASQIGVSRQTLSKYETGESLPDIDMCSALAKVFGITVDDLINYDKEENMEAADVSEDQFETLAFCACGEDINKFADEFDKQSREDLIKESGGSAKAPRKNDVSELDKIRDQGILSAKNAIAQYRNGDPKLYSKTITLGEITPEWWIK